MSIIYIYLYMHYMLKRRVEQWVCLCVCVYMLCGGEQGQGWTGRERDRVVQSGIESELYEKHISGCCCSYSRRGGGWACLGFFCSFLRFQLPDSIRFDYHLIILFISILLNSLFAASLWFLIFSSSSSSCYSFFFFFSSSALSSSLCLAVVLVVVVIIVVIIYSYYILVLVI